MSIWRMIFLASCLLLFVACQVESETAEATRPVATALQPDRTTEPEAPATPDIQPTAESLVQAVVVTTVPPPSSPTVAVTITPPALGSAERPIQLLFPPLTEGSIISARGEVLAGALSEASGLAFDVGIVDSEATLLQLLCSAPGDVIGILSAAGYVLAEEQCAAQVGPVAQDADDGLPWQAGMVVTRRDSGLDGIEDLDGKRWAVASSGGLPTMQYFQAEMAANGIEPGEMMIFPEDSSALLAVLNGEADFATAAYVPPILPFAEEWTYGDDSPEPWRITGISPQRSPIGYVLVNGEPEQGGYRLRDARARLFDTSPTIFDETTILTLSQPMPNQTVVFGGDIPRALVREIGTVLVEFGASEACATSLCAGDLYGWTGLQPAEDEAYDSVRFVIEQLALTAADLGLSGLQED
jgi:phosphonate transport system substrate-binding protein